MSDFDLHKHLIGRQGSRLSLNTPALVIDRDVLQRNIEAMAAFAKANGMALRPHAKTHKSVEIAKLQMAAGAVGVCCAKLGEAEALAHVRRRIRAPAVDLRPGAERADRPELHLESALVLARDEALDRDPVLERLLELAGHVPAAADHPAQHERERQR